MDRSMKGNSSKELLYSEYTGTSVAEHVLETLEQKSDRNSKKKVDKPIEKTEKSETFERIRKLMGLIKKEQDAPNALAENVNEKSNASADIENKEGIEVVMEVDENSPESKINAWFFIDLQKRQESKCSEEEAVKNSSALLNSSYSSDSSDNESEQNFPLIANQFVLNDTVSSTAAGLKQNLKPSKTSSSSLHFLNHDSSDTSNDELEQNFPVISNGFMLNDSDSSDCSNVENESNLSGTFKLQNTSNFVNDDSSNSSDTKSGLYPSVCKSSVSKENQGCIDSDALQLSISLKKDKRKFEIVSNKSSEYLNCESEKCSDSTNPKRLSAKKKTMFIVNDSSDHSLGECEYNRSLYNRQEHFAEDNCSDSSSNMGNALISKKEKITPALESETSKFMSNGTGDLKKRKLCVVEDEISNACDIENQKKVCVLDKRV